MDTDTGSKIDGTDAEAVKAKAVDSLRRSIASAFETMAGLTAQVGEEYIDHHGGGQGPNVAGIIGWVGNWNGTGILECLPEFACNLSNLMLGTEVTTLNEDVVDAVAEMTNIIFGGMKTELEADLGTMGLSTPTVIYGNDVGMRSTGEPFIILPVRIDEASLRIKLYMVRIEDKRHPLSHFWAATHCGAL
jgi:chemotaxis protein CheX